MTVRSRPCPPRCLRPQSDESAATGGGETTGSPRERKTWPVRMVFSGTVPSPRWAAPLSAPHSLPPTERGNTHTAIQGQLTAPSSGAAARQIFPAPVIRLSAPPVHFLSDQAYSSYRLPRIGIIHGRTGVSVCMNTRYTEYGDNTSSCRVLDTVQDTEYIRRQSYRQPRILRHRASVKSKYQTGISLLTLVGIGNYRNPSRDTWGSHHISGTPPGRQHG